MENLEKSVENLEKKCEKQFQNRPGSLYRPLKQLGENSAADKSKEFQEIFSS